MNSALPTNLPSLIPYDPDELLLGYQKRWMLDDSPLKIAEKSRRTGLTWAEAADAVLTASKAKSAGGTNHFYVGSNKEMAREFIDAVAMWAVNFNEVASTISEEIFVDETGDKDILTFVVTFASGFKVQALSSNPKNLRGMQGNVTIDEAAFHEKLAEVLKAALALTMWGAKVRLISTHNGIENQFNELIDDSRAGKKRYSVHTITLDDACKEGLYQRICQITKVDWSQEKEDEWKANLLNDTATQEDADEEYNCIPKQGGGAYLSRALIETRLHKAPVLRLERSKEWNQMPVYAREADIKEWCEKELEPLLAELPRDKNHCFGEDFARSGDLTVLAPGTKMQDLTLSIPFLVELKNIPFSQQFQIICYLIDGLPRFTGGAMDARGNGQQIAEDCQDKYGTDLIECVMLSEKFYREQMPRLKAAFDDDLIRIPRDKDVLDDLRAIQRNHNGVPCLPKGKTDSKNNRHGDAAIAIFLANYATQMEGAAIEFTPIPSRHDANYEQYPDDDSLQAHYQEGCW